MNLRKDNENICQTKLSKFLGVYIDCKLNWQIHINYVSGKFARGIGILVKSRKIFNDECLKKLYHAFVYPYLNYCNHIWGNTYKTSLSNLQILQNRSIRMITGSPPRTSNDLLYKQHGMLNLKNINIFLVGKFMYNVYHGMVPPLFEGFFVKNNDIHEHNTRISNHSNVPPVHSNISKSSIRYQGVIVWNEILKADINLDASELSFKIMLKRGIQQEVITMLPQETKKNPFSLCIALYRTAPPALVFLFNMNCVPDYGAHKPLGVSSSHLPLYNLWFVVGVLWCASTVSMMMSSLLCALYCIYFGK